MLELGLERDIDHPKLGKVIILIVYVDDMILASNCPQKMEEVKLRLSPVFKMKILGEPKVFLSMKIDRDRENQILTLTQSDYIENCLEKFGMKDCTPMCTPMVTKQVKNKDQKKLNASEEKPTNDTLIKGDQTYAIRSHSYKQQRG